MKNSYEKGNTEALRFGDLLTIAQLIGNKAKTSNPVIHTRVFPTVPHGL